jgi:hypothetical protein
MLPGHWAVQGAVLVAERQPAVLGWQTKVSREVSTLVMTGLAVVVALPLLAPTLLW